MSSLRYLVVQLKIAVYGSVVANVALFGLQLAAAILSGSLSIFATMADAFMDLLSSMILLWATRQAEKPNLMKYPAVRTRCLMPFAHCIWAKQAFHQGKARMETAGIIVFSCLMACVAIFLIVSDHSKLQLSHANT